MDTQANQILLATALEALEQSTGARAQLASQAMENERDPSHAARVQITLNNVTNEYFITCKPNVDRASVLSNVKEQFRSIGNCGILVAPYISERMAETCRELDLQFFDVAGNVYLNRSKTLVYISGKKLKDRQHLQSAGRGVGSPATMRLIFALLCEHGLLKRPYREIAERTGISLGAVGKALHQLEERGYIGKPDEKFGRKVLAAERMLTEWAAVYASQIRPKLPLRRYSARDSLWWQNLDLQDTGAMWGGEVAANHLNGYLTPEEITIYLSAENTFYELAVKHRLRADPKGNIEVLPTFWKVKNIDIQRALVPTILVYADLIGSMDSRNNEAAELIRKQHLNFNDA